MESLIFNVIIIIFPVLMYLVFGCYNTLVNRKIENIVFILTICTSLYLVLLYSTTNGEFLLFCNIPILICYFKKEWKLGFILSIVSVIYGMVKFNLPFLYVTAIKYLMYLFTYYFLSCKKEFNYLFLKVSGIVQGFFISFEYFMFNFGNIYDFMQLIFSVLLIYIVTFFCLYLFSLADGISYLYLTVNKIKDENKLKDSLFKLTHEIKNPIAVCKGYIDMIDVNDSVKTKKYVNIIKSEIDRSLNVMSDFMDYSKVKISKDELDIIMLLEDIYQSFEILACSKNIKLNYNSEYDEVYLLGDYDRLKQVFVNIIKNSIESIDDNGIINIDVMLDKDKFVIISISDNGVGMDEEELCNLKTMFYTTKRNGTGIGVALSNEIVVAHSGELIYESEKNVGTKCIVKLPI